MGTRVGVALGVSVSSEMFSGARVKVEVGTASELHATETDTNAKVKTNEITLRRIGPAMPPYLNLLTELMSTMLGLPPSAVLTSLKITVKPG